MKFSRIFSAFLCVVLIVLLCSCHGSTQVKEFSVPDEFDTKKQFEISFWAKNDTNVKQTRIYEKAIQDFEKLYPNIKVTIRLYTDYSRIYNDVITNISTNTTPNVCITYPDHIATYLTGDNVVIPLDELMNNEKYGLGGCELKYSSPSSNQMIEKFLSECELDGVHYAIPFMRSTEACYINKTYVEKLGFEVPDILTWEYIWKVSEAATAKDNDGNYTINGQKVMIPFIYKSTDNMMIQMLHQLGAGYSDNSGNIEIFNNSTKKILLDISSHVSSGAFSTFKISSYPGNFLNAGQCIFAIDSTAGATWIGTDAPLSDIAEENIVNFETVVRPIPQYNTQDISMISQGPSICVFNKSDPQEVMASWLFAQYLLTNDVQIAYSETEGYVPVTKMAQESKEYIDYLEKCGVDTDTHYHVKIEAAKLLLANVNNTFVTPVWNGSASLRQAAGELIEGVCKGVRRGKNVNEEYIDSLFDDVTSLYRLDQTSVSLQTGPKELDEMPTASIILLTSLGCAWFIIISVAIIGKIRKNKRNNS